MRVCVTGGTGFIGQYLIRDYAKEYDFVVPVRNNSNIEKWNTSAEYRECDFSVDSLKGIFKNCDVVIHLAAKGMPKKKEALRMEDYTHNIECAAHVFEACKELGIKNIICTSTKAVWGQVYPDETKFLKEYDIPNPDDEYGVSKLCVETLAHFYQHTYGMNITLFRMAEVCGIDLTRGMLNPFWSVVLNAVIEKRVVPIYGKGIAGRDLIYVKDVARALVLGIEKKKAGIYNIGAGYITTNIEIAKMFCDIFNDKAGIEFHPEKEEWGTTVCMDTKKARDELGYKALYNLRDIVLDIKEEYRKYNR